MISPEVVSPLCEDWISDYFTHWTRIVIPQCQTSDEKRAG
jgi:hypothetical protein